MKKKKVNEWKLDDIWIKIERILTDEKGQITALDIYDNEKKQAVFLEAKGRH